uniref:Chloroplast protein-transporting ATPase n=1 Tax=Panagrolaimus davidi TaxID=227884 RepID=A0A914QP57_9BILA
MKSHNPDAGEASPQWISEMCKELSNKESFYNKWIIAIDNVMFEKKKIRLRDTQKLAIMTIASNKSNLLAQVNTGEGKSFIIAALAIIRAKEFGFLDIITSSPVLAQRDGEEMKVVYEAFGLTVGHNCDEQLEKRKLAYKANIIYGDIPRPRIRMFGFLIFVYPQNR